MPALLLIEDAGRTLLVLVPAAEPVVVGRSSSADVTIDAPRASRRHLAVRPDGRGGHLVEDLETTNGTLLEGRPLLAGPFPLSNGAEIRLGECRIVYQNLP